jgi:hypothetical protein
MGCIQYVLDILCGDVVMQCGAHPPAARRIE